MKMREIGIKSSAYFTCGDVDQGFARMAKHGYTNCDYEKFVRVDRPWFNVSDDQFEKQCLEDRMLAEKHGVKIDQTHAPWLWPAKNLTAKDRDEWFDNMVKALHGTKLLNCKNFVIHPLMPWNGDELDKKFLWDVNLEFFNRLIPHAKQNGITLCFENMPMKDLSISTVEACIEFLDMLNSEQMGICLDTGHAWVFGTQPADAVRLLGNRIKAFHVHDNHGGYDHHLLPCMGSIDWEAFKIALKECVDESVPLDLETSAPRNLPLNVKEGFETALADLARYLAN